MTCLACNATRNAPTGSTREDCWLHGYLSGLITGLRLAEGAADTTLAKMNLELCARHGEFAQVMFENANAPEGLYVHSVSVPSGN